MLRSATINVMVSAVRKAGRRLARDFGEIERLQVSKKGPADFVSSADLKAEEILIDTLEKARPDYGFLTEESGVIAGADKSHRWIVDPLDGTTNFLHGIPLFTISLALEREGELVSGVVYNPLSDELYVAEKGQGAYGNNKRLRASVRDDMATAVLLCGLPDLGRADSPQLLKDMMAVMDHVAGLRRTGSAALDLAWVAAGRADGFWDRGLAPWDMAAGMVLMQEAGGLVSGFDGTASMFDTGGIVAANGQIHGPLLKLLASA